MTARLILLTGRAQSPRLHMGRRFEGCVTDDGCGAQTGGGGGATGGDGEGGCGEGGCGDGGGGDGGGGESGGGGPGTEPHAPHCGSAGLRRRTWIPQTGGLQADEDVLSSRAQRRAHRRVAAGAQGVLARAAQVKAAEGSRRAAAAAVAQLLGRCQLRQVSWACARWNPSSRLHALSGQTYAC